MQKGIFKYREHGEFVTKVTRNRIQPRWPTMESWYRVECRYRGIDRAEEQARRHRIAGRGVGRSSLDITEVRISTQLGGTARERKKGKAASHTKLSELRSQAGGRLAGASADPEKTKAARSFYKYPHQCRPQTAGVLETPDVAA